MRRKRAGLRFDDLLAETLHEDLVVFAEDDDLRRVRGGFFRRVVAETHDRHDVADASEVRRRAVEAEDAAAAFAGDRVGLQAAAVRGVHDEDAFVGQDVRQVQIIRVDGETPLVIEVTRGQTRTVYFAFKKFQCHDFGRLQKRVEVY